MNAGMRSSRGKRKEDGICSDASFLGLLLILCAVYYGYVTFSTFGDFTDGSLFDSRNRAIGRDFVNYWTGGVAVWDGFVSDLFNPARYHRLQEALFGPAIAVHYWSYPPHTLLLTAPLGGMPYFWALALWSFVGLGLYLWASAAGEKDQRLIILALVLAPASFTNLLGGQNGFFTAALLIGGLRLLGPNPVAAGVLFGLLTVKPQLGILLPFALLAARQWTAIASATLTTAGLIGASGLFFGWESWQAYLEVIVPLQSNVMTRSSGGFLAMMPSPYMALRIVNADPLLRQAVQAIFSAAALAGVVWAFARSEDWGLRFGVLAVGTILASPYSFNYDMTAVTFAVILAGLRALKRGFRPGERFLLGTVWLLPLFVYWLNSHYLPLSPILLLACFAYFIGCIRKSDVAGPGLPLETPGSPPKFGPQQPA